MCSDNAGAVTIAARKIRGIAVLCRFSRLLQQVIDMTKGTIFRSRIIVLEIAFDLQFFPGRVQQIAAVRACVSEPTFAQLEAFQADKGFDKRV